MVIGNVLGFSSVGSAYARAAPLREAVTLEARVNPHSPNEYAVQLPAEIFKLKAESAASGDSAVSKPYQNRDPASRAFLAVADNAQVKHNIDIFV